MAADPQTAIQRDIRILRRGQPAVRVACMGFLCAVFTQLPAALRDMGDPTPTPVAVVALAGTLCCLPLLGLQWLLWRRIARRAEAASLGALAEGVAYASGRAEVELEKALVSRLPGTRPGDYAQLTGAQRRALRSILTRQTPWAAGAEAPPIPVTRLAILQMLRECGGEECTQAVASVARGSYDSRVREAARECLEVLQARLQEQRPTANLLRPAEAPDGATLLRPAQTSQETPQEQLLRPAGIRKHEG